MQNMSNSWQWFFELAMADNTIGLIVFIGRQTQIDIFTMHKFLVDGFKNSFTFGTFQYYSTSKYILPSLCLRGYIYIYIYISGNAN